jgi:hypothetical protein
MKYLILLQLVLLAYLPLNGGNKVMKNDPVFFLNEPRVWSSFEEVYITAESPSRASDGYSTDQHQAVSIGVEKLYQVLVMLKRENNDPRVATATQNVIINNRSVVDLAIIGVMIILGETSKYTMPITPELLQEVYKEKVRASDIENERRRALEALEILVKLKADGAKLAGNDKDKPKGSG